MIKPPFAYYGGKQQLLKYLLPIIESQPHVCFCEPFIGGGAVYWTRETRPKNLVINDLNGYIVNLYRTMKSDYRHLQAMLEDTLYSEAAFKAARLDKDNPNTLTRAYNTYLGLQMAFAHDLYHSFGTSRKRSQADAFRSGVKRLAEHFALWIDRLEHTTIHEKDALEVIKQYDAPTTLFYIDPPYPETYCGNQKAYRTYSIENFEELLKVLAEIKGCFVLSCFSNDLIETYITTYGWKVLRVSQWSTADHRAETAQKTKVELIITNFESEVLQTMEKEIKTATGYVEKKAVIAANDKDKEIKKGA